MPLRRLPIVLLGCALLGGVAQAQQLPEPQPYYQPPPPEYPQPIYAQPQPPPPPQLYTRPVLRPPGFRPQFGLGLHVQGSWSYNGLQGFGQGGLGLDLLLRATPHVVTELSIQYQRVGPDLQPTYDRSDLPIILGLRYHFGSSRWVVSPYLAVATGLTYSNLQLPGLLEQAWFIDAQLGGGLEIRIGRHFSLLGDLRGVGRLRVDQGSRLVADDGTGNLRELMGHQIGLQVNGGLAVFF